jgi:hypothetical protein
MSTEKRKLSHRERQIYMRLLARTRPYRGRLALAVVFGILFGGSVFGLLFSAKGGMAQVSAAPPRGCRTRSRVGSTNGIPGA